MAKTRKQGRKQLRKKANTRRQRKRGGGLPGNAIVSVQQDPYSPSILMDYETYTNTKDTADPRF
jgi:hypothetical protein